ncbi:right-handed parallel beta-helix repeat-containing protein [Georgenia subflava]|uniref:right-handed parallel beta-helix repeat-containing protein n=2 Tax=Georgenia subflava TaxID=1622177 RepID=UPI0012656824|nr:right-handed parallel beta-helix repeat-containing protein [Georgenia subflava]
MTKHVLVRPTSALVTVGATLALGAGLVVSAGLPAQAAGVGAADATLTSSGTITITEPGTVIDGRHVNGSINVKADDVTIKNSKVTYGGYHSIRIFPGAEGTHIENTTVECVGARTNGIVFGNYTAVDVALEDCRNDFMFSSSSPAVIVDSSIDGGFFSHAADELEEAPELAPEPDATPSLSPAPTPEPTPGETPVPAPTPAPEPAPGSEVSDGRFPDASSTGVPVGTSLTVSGSLKITEPGTVIDAVHVKGTITIAADDVTVRRSLVESATPQYPIKVEAGVTGALIEDVEVDNLNGTGIGVFFSGGSGTLRRADIHSAEDGIRVEADDVTVEDSYVHDLHRQPGGHHDAFQIRKGDNVTLRGNNFQAYNASTDDPMNAAIQIGSLLGDDRISNFVVEDNLFNGGNYTINGGRSGDVDSARYSGNEFGPDYRYAAVGNIHNSNFDSTNVWAATGQPVR